MKDDRKHLYYLEELSDYKVDSHYSDVRGWPVKDNDNRVIGKVSNLLVNLKLEKVVYLDVEVDSAIIEENHDPYAGPVHTGVREFVNKKGENHIIIPIGMVTIDEAHKFVFTESINYLTFAGTKRVSSGANIDRDYEMMVLNSYNRDNRRYQEHLEGINASTKESPYAADRRKKRADDVDNSIENIENIRAELKTERKHLEEERRKLEAERIELREERKKLQIERKRHTEGVDTRNVHTDFEAPNEFANKENLYPDDESFYKRREFDGSKDFD